MLTALDQIEGGEQGRGARPQRVGKVHGTDLRAGVEHSGDGGRGLLLAIGRSRGREEHSREGLRLTAPERVNAGVDR